MLLGKNSYYIRPGKRKGKKKKVGGEIGVFKKKKREVEKKLGKMKINSMKVR